MRKSRNKPEKMTARQTHFAAEYLANGGNATRAAIAAGYSRKGAEVAGCQLLRNPKVAAVIGEKTQARLDRLEISADKVLQELAGIGFSEGADVLKVRSLELLGKHLKLFTDKAEISGADGGPIETKIVVEFVKTGE